jgi:hypothetical protein
VKPAAMARCTALLRAPHGGRWQCLREAAGPSGLCLPCFAAEAAQQAAEAADAATLTAPYLQGRDPGDEHEETPHD